MGSEAVTARVASAAMAMVTARTEDDYHIVGFSHHLVPLAINATMQLGDVCDVIDKVKKHKFCNNRRDLLLLAIPQSYRVVQECCMSC